MKGKPMKTIKRIITLITALAVMASMAVTAVQASPGNPEFMLAIGDSITTGYGLEDYMEGESPYLCSSYANMVANALGLKGGESYINKAVNGATSTDLLKLLPDLEKFLGYSEFIVVTIGGNDLLGAVPLVASAISGKNITSLGSAIDILTAATPEDFAALANHAGFQRQISGVLTKYATNLAAIAEIIKKNAPDAHVLFLKQYNPMKNVLGFGDFGNFADTLIDNINATMQTVCTTYGFDIADAPSVINVNAVGLTNMLNYDIHPNAAGHVELAKLVASHLGISLDPSENTFEEVTTEAPETEPETEPATDTLPEQTEAEATEPAEDKKGCGSAISCASILLSAACAFVIVKKKTEV